jgi:hypothetical protein
MSACDEQKSSCEDDLNTTGTELDSRRPANQAEFLQA